MKNTGYTYMHEHVTIDLSGVKQDLDCRVDCFEETVKEFKELYDLGVRVIVDVTNMGMGRDCHYIKAMEEATKLKIIQSTGFYKDPFLPEIVETLSVSALSELILKEIEEGIESNKAVARMIGEIGTSNNQMTVNEQKVFDASIIAAIQSQCPIYTHTTLGTYALEQVQYLTQRGVEADKIVIGHVDLSKNLDLIIQLIETGVNVGFDTIGKNNYFPDEKRAEFLIELEKRNLCHHVVLSMDITRKTNFKYRGGIGYSYLITDFLPMLRNLGMKEETIDMMLIDNPNRILKGASL